MPIRPVAEPTLAATTIETPRQVRPERDTNPETAGLSQADEAGLHDPDGRLTILVRRVERPRLATTVQARPTGQRRTAIAPDDGSSMGAALHVTVAGPTCAELDTTRPSPARRIELRIKPLTCQDSQGV